MFHAGLNKFTRQNRCNRIDFVDAIFQASHNRCDLIVLVPPVEIQITSPQQLGLVVRATRKTQKLRLDDLAGTAGVGHVFAREVERGKETVQLGRVMKLLAELGIELRAEVSADVAPELARLQSAGIKPLRRRRAASTRAAGHEPQDS